MKCSGTNNKLKLKLKKNGFFEDSEPLNSHRAGDGASDNMLNDMNSVEQCINSNANTDRGHHHGMLINNGQDKPPVLNEARVIKNDIKVQQNSHEDKSIGKYYTIIAIL